MDYWTRQAKKINEARDNRWIWPENAERIKSEKPKKAEKQKKPKKPEKGNYWIIASVKDGEPYYLAEIETHGKDITYTWRPRKSGKDTALIFLSEDEAWDTAYKCRGTVITKTVKKKEAAKHEADKD